MRGNESSSEILAVVALSLASWVLGVAWAAYRAIGWADRVRVWAWSELVIESSTFGVDDYEGYAEVVPGKNQGLASRGVPPEGEN